MFITDYQPEEYKIAFDCQDGIHSLTIGGARICNSKSGNQMIEVAIRSIISHSGISNGM